MATIEQISALLKHELQQQVGQRLDTLFERLDSFEAHAEQTDERLAKLAARAEHTDAILASVIHRLERYETQFDSLASSAASQDSDVSRPSAAKRARSFDD